MKYYKISKDELEIFKAALISSKIGSDVINEIEDREIEENESMEDFVDRNKEINKKCPDCDSGMFQIIKHCNARYCDHSEMLSVHYI